MKYVKTGDVLAVRLDPGEEIIASVLKIAKDENIRFAEISAIGAVGRAVFGLYDLNEQKYHSLTFNQPLELVSLNGNLSLKDGEPYLHLHAAFADEKGAVIGGHLNEAVISATCEMFIRTFDMDMGRRISEQTGLNIFDI